MLTQQKITQVLLLLEPYTFLNTINLSSYVKSKPLTIVFDTHQTANTKPIAYLINFT